MYTFSKFFTSLNFEWLTNNFSVAHWVHPGLNTNYTCITGNLNIDNKTLAHFLILYYYVLKIDYKTKTNFT